MTDITTTTDDEMTVQDVEVKSRKKKVSCYLACHRTKYMYNGLQRLVFDKPYSKDRDPSTRNGRNLGSKATAPTSSQSQQNVLLQQISIHGSPVDLSIISISDAAGI